MHRDTRAPRGYIAANEWKPYNSHLRFSFLALIGSCTCKNPCKKDTGCETVFPTTITTKLVSLLLDFQENTPKRRLFRRRSSFHLEQLYVIASLAPDHGLPLSNKDHGGGTKIMVDVCDFDLGLVFDMVIGIPQFTRPFSSIDNLKR